MSNSQDPNFLFNSPGNINAISYLLSPEAFNIIEVKRVNSPTNNTIALLELLAEDEDEDGLPIVVKTNIKREIHYDRELLSTALTNVLERDTDGRLTLSAPEGFVVTTEAMVELLIENGFNVGEDAITARTIGKTDIVELITTSKSIRYSGSARIALTIL